MNSQLSSKAKMRKVLKSAYNKVKIQGLGAHAPFRQIREIISKVLKEEEIDTKIKGRDYHFYLDKTDALKLSLNGIYEPNEVDLVYKTAKPGWRVLDIGAHIGYYTVLLSKLVGESGRVTSFEPQPEAIECLKKNVSVNNCKNVSLNFFALSDKDNTGNLVIGKKNSGGTHIGKSGVKIELRKFDDLKIGRVDFVKMDVEGHELRVLKGMEKTLKKYKPAMLIEYLPSFLERYGDNGDNLLSYLKNLGYKFLWVNGKEYGKSLFAK